MFMASESGGRCKTKRLTLKQGYNLVSSALCSAGIEHSNASKDDSNFPAESQYFGCRDYQIRVSDHATKRWTCFSIVLSAGMSQAALRREIKEAVRWYEKIHCS
jgi:hypothetical protein